MATRRAAILVFFGAAVAGGRAAAAAVAPLPGLGRSPSSQQERDLDLLLRDEIAARSESSKGSALLSTPPSPWTLLAKSQTSKMQLERTYKGEGGKEDILISSLSPSSFMRDSVFFRLTLSKGPSSPRIEFLCLTSESPLDGPFSIRQSSTLAPTTDSSQQEVELDFSSLPRAMQSGLYAYLQDRGIDRELCAYMRDLVARSHEQDYGTWLSRLQAYVKL